MTARPSPPDPLFIEHVRQRRERLAVACAELLAGIPSITLEIGCGHGHFLTEFAERFPGRQFVGIDLIRGRIERARRKQARAGLQNVHYVPAEANEFLEALPAATQLAAVFVLFPDPWPKRRHHKNRLINPAFLSVLAARCAGDARLYFRTDVFDYFVWAEEIITAHADWRVLDSEPWPFERVTVFQEKSVSFYSLSAVKAGPATK